MNLRARTHAATPVGVPAARPDAAERPVSIERIDSASGLEALASEWDELIERSRHPVVFQSFDFVRTEWEHLGWEHEGTGPAAEPFVLAARQDGRLTGLYPLVRERARLRGVPLVRLRPLGNLYLERGDPVVDPEFRDETLEGLFRHLIGRERRWHLLLARNTSEGSPLAEFAESSAARRLGLRVDRTPGLVSPYVVRDGSWEEYLASRSKNFHKALNNRRNRLRRSGDELRIDECRTPEEVERGLEAAFRIDLASWKGRDGTAISSTPASRAYWTALAERLARAGRLRLWLLRLGQRPVAFELHAQHRDRVFSMKWSFDAEYERYSPGLVLKAQSMEAFWRPEVHEIDLLGINDRFKEMWTARRRAHTNWHFFHPGPYGRLAYTAAFVVGDRVQNWVARARARRSGRTDGAGG